MLPLLSNPKDEHRDAPRRPAFRDSYEVFKEHGAEVLGVSSDSVESHTSSAANHNLSFPLLSDIHGDLREGVRGRANHDGREIRGGSPMSSTQDGVVRGIFTSRVHPEQHIDEALKMLG